MLGGDAYVYGIDCAMVLLHQVVNMCSFLYVNHTLSEVILDKRKNPL